MLRRRAIDLRNELDDEKLRTLEGAQEEVHRQYRDLTEHRDTRACPVCLGATVTRVVCVPCGHLVACEACWRDMPVDQKSKCPTCR